MGPWLAWLFHRVINTWWWAGRNLACLGTHRWGSAGLDGPDRLPHLQGPQHDDTEGRDWTRGQRRRHKAWRVWHPVSGGRGRGVVARVWLPGLSGASYPCCHPHPNPDPWSLVCQVWYMANRCSSSGSVASLIHTGSQSFFISDFPKSGWCL